MNITTYLNNIRDGLTGSDTLIAWCNTNFAKVHTVFKGIDEREPPAASHCPLVAVFPSNKSGGYGLNEHTLGIGVVCIIKKESLTETTVGDDDVPLKEYAGIDLIEAFRKLCETEVAGIAQALGSRIEVIQVEYNMIEFYPFFMAGMEVSIVQEYFQGQDPLA